MTAERERLLKLCIKGLETKGLIADVKYKTRLKKEIKAVDEQGEHEYFLKLYDKFKSENLKFPSNEHNLLIDFLLDLTQEFEIEQESAWIQGEHPDIDVDFIKNVRDYLKRSWASQRFGRENICEIGTYGTSGIKSSMLDMARVHSVPRDEIQSITNKMADKDDEGHELEWDKALEIYPDFKSYCERYPQIADAAKLLLDRIRTGGVHAGGLIISDRPLDGFVPLEVRSVTKDNPDGVICSAWTEGLNRQDLQPVGLIKFDLLVINNLMQIALGCKLVKERHNLTSICAKPGQSDWSDISYLNDPKSIEMANRGDLKCIFQFDSEGIRKLIKKGGVDCFDDVVAYSSLYRPGPLNEGMDVRYCRRKKGEEPYNIHPLLQKSLGKTYGVLIYQEQCQDLLSIVGQIPDMHTEIIRKAISKKKIDKFDKYKEMFIRNGQKVLNVNEEYVVSLWNQIESFAEYGFNKSHATAYCYISARLLWLKSHYPVEFYAATLMCEKDDDKFKDYKLDAKHHGINICSVHVNKSKANFSIYENDIYFGFSSIKGIGHQVAEKIVANQPYRSFMDFLDRFGTDAAVIKALTGLGVFDEPQDRLILRKYSEFYKKQMSGRKDRQKRFELSMVSRDKELREIILEEVPENDPDFEKLCQFNDETDALWQSRFESILRKVPYKYKGEERIREVTFLKMVQDVAKKRQTSINNFNSKEKESDEAPITIDEFNPDLIELDEEEVKLLTDELVVGDQKTFPLAESKFYGFQWNHVLETVPEYTGATLDKFLQEVDSQGLSVGMVEVQIKAVRKRTSKNNVEFYSVDIEDANGKSMVVNIWMDDYTRFQDELIAGNLVKMRIRPPSGGFNTLTFDSVPKKDRKKLPPKEQDARLLVMKLPEKPKEETLDDFKFDESALLK